MSVQANGIPARSASALRPANVPPPPPTRRALVVGINRYGLAGAGEGLGGRGDLRGAENDARRLHELLLGRFGFERQHCRLMLNEEASREGLLAAISSELVEPAAAGDSLVFAFFGHGSFVHNSLGQPPHCQDETLVPADRRHGARDVRDKVLRQALAPALLRGARLTVILDCCHSGSALRGGTPSLRRVRRLPPQPIDVRDGRDYGPKLEDLGAVVLAACQDQQLAVEDEGRDGKCHGAWSEALNRALESSGDLDSAFAVFTRARALLEAQVPGQVPNLSGSPARQAESLFAAAGEGCDQRRLVAVGGVEGSRVRLRAGMAQGLAPGYELRRRSGREATEDHEVVVERVLDAVQAEARLKREVPGRPPLAVGDLLEMTTWVAPSLRPLRLHVPQSGEDERRLRAALTALEAECRARGIRWEEEPAPLDPLEPGAKPPHWLGVRAGGWLRISEAGATSLGATLPEAAVFAGEAPPALLVEVPAPSALVEALDVLRGRWARGIEWTAQAEQADFVLGGRLRRGRLEFAWVRPGAGAGESSLPGRSHFLPLLEGERRRQEGAERLAEELLDSARALAKIHGWLQLESPPEGAWPYRLVLRRGGEELEWGAELCQGDHYDLALLADPERLCGAVESRFVYVFGLDSAGQVQLLYPDRNTGSSDNRVPGTEQAPESPPAEIRLSQGQRFFVQPPFGTDTYFLLTTAQEIPAPWILESEPVRSGDEREEHPLAELLLRCAPAYRSDQPLAVPANWSIERLRVRTRAKE